MNLENIFKNIIKIEFLFIVLVIISLFFIDIEYVDPNGPWTMETTLTIWLFIILLVYVVNLYFLYKFKPIGKTLYLPLLILTLILGTLLPAAQYTSLDLIVEWISGVLTGLVIALLYFTDIKDKFIKK